MQITPQTAARLQANMRFLLEERRLHVDEFYDKLFERAPSVRALFPADLSPQVSKMEHVLALVVTRLDNVNELSLLLRELGTRHAAYGAKPEHYPIVIGILLECLAEGSGPNWTAQLETDWSGVLEFVAAGMTEGGTQVGVP